MQEFITAVLQMSPVPILHIVSSQNSVNFVSHKFFTNAYFIEYCICNNILMYVHPLSCFHLHFVHILRVWPDLGCCCYPASRKKQIIALVLNKNKENDPFNEILSTFFEIEEWNPFFFSPKLSYSPHSLSLLLSSIFPSLVFIFSLPRFLQEIVFILRLIQSASRFTVHK